jgi:hypothetical protein
VIRFIHAHNPGAGLGIPPRLAEGIMPIEPVRVDASSVIMSPKYLRHDHIEEVDLDEPHRTCNDQHIHTCT